MGKAIDIEVARQSNKQTMVIEWERAKMLLGRWRCVQVFRWFPSLWSGERLMIEDKM